jgi:ubiquinone/menaquinone biosynthesis C-methylase UbiE
MKQLRSLLFITIAIVSFLNSNGQEKYIIKGGDPNGINKWYMGRQIAHVMSHWGIDWLERPERQFEENSALLLKNLNLKSGMQIADIGAGSGYYTSLIAKRIGNGKVYAVDVEPQMILFLNERIKEEKLSNVVTVLGSETSVRLPASSLDMMLLVDVYHEFSFPYEMGQSMYNALKPDGRLVLVEFRSEDETVPIKTIHKMSVAQSVKELKAVGFKLEKNISNLPWQHCMVFVKENTNAEKK